MSDSKKLVRVAELSLLKDMQVSEIADGGFYLVVVPKRYTADRMGDLSEMLRKMAEAFGLRAKFIISPDDIKFYRLEDDSK